MKILYILLIASLISLFIMIAVDYLLGARAEFVNAWSVVERLVGKTPVAGDSVVHQRFGATGELITVLAINIAIGAILTIVFKFWAGI